MNLMEEQPERVFIRTGIRAADRRRGHAIGVAGWIRANFFSSWWSGLATLVVFYVLYRIAVAAFDFVFVHGVWSGSSRAVCATVTQDGVQPSGWFGGCWIYVRAYIPQFIYGLYPAAERWRADWVFALFFCGLIPLLVPRIPFKAVNAIFMATVFPVAAFILLTGGHIGLQGFLLPTWLVPPSRLRFALDYAVLTGIALATGYAVARATRVDPWAMLRAVAGVAALFAIICALVATDFGLRHVETSRWGGLLLTLVIAVTSMVVALPAGIVLALGRRSKMPVVRLLSTIFIEFWRGVPLVSILFMGTVMLPLFLPAGASFDSLLRALFGIAMFAAAYMAEVVRGGLQAIPKGQYEGASALGLSYWQTMISVVLPQALKIVIPGIVNIFISLFKDTTLVLTIGLFDFLGQIQASFADPKWASPVQVITAYSFAALVYFIFCYSMGQYSKFMEHRGRTGQ
jgi:general L-amino acid transport system permease protein